MKITLAKNTWIDDISAGFLTEGLFKGVFAMEITFSGGDCPGDEFIASVAKEILRQRFPRRKIARLKGLYSKDSDSLTLVISLLKSWGFQVQAVIVDGYSAAWLKDIDWLIVQLRKPLLLSKPNELWYFPAAADKIPEPTIAPTLQPVLYLAKGTSLATATDFVTNAERAWAIL